MSPLRTRVLRLAASRPVGDPLRKLLARVTFESRHNVGEPVWVVVQGQRVAGNVRAVTFTSGKVRYAVKVETAEGWTTLHNLESALIEVRPEGDYVDFGFDNYS